MHATGVHGRCFLLLFSFLGFKTLQHSYLLKVNGAVMERPQHMIMRVSCGIHCGDLQSVIQTYNLMSLKWFTHATPTLFNAGTRCPQLSSCFLVRQGNTMTDMRAEGARRNHSLILTRRVSGCSC